MQTVKASEQTRQRLIDTGLVLFAREGYENVSVDELVRNANVTKGAFYHHFASKEHFLTEMHIAFVDFAYERFLRIAEVDSSPEAELGDLISELVDQVHRFRNEVVVLWEARRNVAADRSAEVEQKKRQIRHLFVEAISRGQKEGVFQSSHDPRLAALGIFGMCMWAYHWYNPAGGCGPAEVAANFSNLVLRGLYPSAHRVLSVEADEVRRTYGASSG